MCVTVRMWLIWRRSLIPKKNLKMSHELDVSSASFWPFFFCSTNLGRTKFYRKCLSTKKPGELEWQHRRWQTWLGRFDIVQGPSKEFREVFGWLMCLHQALDNSHYPVEVWQGQLFLWYVEKYHVLAKGAILITT